LKRLDPSKIEPPGRMYEVALHATPEQFLDWDKPLSGQSEAVRKALPYDNRSGMSVPNLMHTIARAHALPRDKGAVPSQYQSLSEAQRDVASGVLREAGIPGIRYLDQGSRDKAFRVNLTDHKGRPYETEPQLFGSREMAERYAAEKKAQGFGADIVNNGTSNYVVWSPELIEILRKYAAPPAIAAPALASILQDQQSQ
jgi:hypothetical protein